MTLADLTPHEQDLLALINKKMGEMKESQDEQKKSQDSFIGRFLTSVAIGVTMFLAIITGCFAYAGRVDSEVNEVKKEVIGVCKDLNTLERDVGDIDGALFLRFPGSAVFGTANRRLIKKRGGSPPKD